jgi:hypothetical protein
MEFLVRFVRDVLDRLKGYPKPAAPIMPAPVIEKKKVASPPIIERQILRRATQGTPTPAITHSLGATPTGCLVTPSLTNTSVDVVGLTSTTFLINGTKTGTTTYTAMTSQTIYWECWV